MVSEFIILNWMVKNQTNAKTMVTGNGMDQRKFLPWFKFFDSSQLHGV